MSGAVLIAGVIVLAVVVVVWLVVTYNGLVRSRNAYQKAFAQIDVQLTRRHELIPNLVETAKGYLRHEREALEAVTTARAGAISAQSAASAHPGEPAAMQQLAGAENALTQTLGRFFAVSEAYPELRADQNMMQLSEELTTTENRVAFARQHYNDAVLAYNNRREAVPATFFARMLGFQPAAFFEIDSPEERQVPRVSF
jgi:LemA protein